MLLKFERRSECRTAGGLKIVSTSIFAKPFGWVSSAVYLNWVAFVFVVNLVSDAEIVA